MKRPLIFCAIWLGSVVVTGRGLPASDWPTYRSDGRRSARQPESLPLPLELNWTHRAPLPPSPAWPRSDRMTFDRVDHPVVQGERLLLGSSADGSVVAIDARSGSILWEFFTEAPVRFAPTIWQDRAFVVSDDGWLYALNLGDGTLLWKRQGGPGNQNVIGNRKMVSKWPARGGPVVRNGTVYYAAGIWPSDGIFLYALDAGTGNVVWKNDDSGSIYMPQPHGGANAASGIAAQGYLTNAGDQLIVPTGRAVPAVFDTDGGKLSYFHLQKYGHNGGSLAMASGAYLINGGIAFRLSDGSQIAPVGGQLVAASAKGLAVAAGRRVGEFQWTVKQRPDKKGVMQEVSTIEPLWTVELPTAPVALATAGPYFVLGSVGQVSVLDTVSRQIVWRADVEGSALGLAVTDRRLFASTDRGLCYCFDSAADRRSSDVASVRSDERVTMSDSAESAAEQIIERTGITRGFCLDLGCGDGSLALALARRTELTILAVDSDERNVDNARSLLRAAGLYGSRVFVHRRTLDKTGYPQYFANLIVSGRTLHLPVESFPRQEAHRLQHPDGGVICVGRENRWQVDTRGPLAGAGQWTHQYADPANSCNSGDEIVKGRLGMLWFRDFDFDVPSRHGRAPAPLFRDGRIYHAGLDQVIAVDAYNGQELWRYDIPNLLRAYDGDELMGVSGTGSNFCLGAGSLFVRNGSKCLQLDALTGTLQSEYDAAPTPGSQAKPWGYIAWSDGILFGSTARADHVVTYRYVNRGGDMNKQLTESDSLFAVDTSTGSRLWTFTAKHSIRHNAIAISGDRVLLIDRPEAKFDRTKKAPATPAQPAGELIALNARTGKVVWRQAEDVFGTMLAASDEHGIVLMSYQPTRFRLASEVGGRLAAFRLADGTCLWSIKADYSSRPMLNGRTVYTQGGAWDLLTGEPVPFEFQRSYGCGILASSRHMLLFRSATLGYFDLSGRKETENYGGIRPGCWINALPVGGIVVVPDASSGCRCSYLNRAWIGLEPVATGGR